MWELDDAATTAPHSRWREETQGVFQYPKAVPLVSGCCLLCGRLASETHRRGQEDSLQVLDGWTPGTLPLHKTGSKQAPKKEGSEVLTNQDSPHTLRGSVQSPPKASTQ